MRTAISIAPDNGHTSNLPQLGLAVVMADGLNVAETAKRMGMNERVQKAAVAPHFTTDSDLDGLDSTRTILTQFAPLLRNTSAFFRLIDSSMMLRVPMRQRATWLTGTMTAGVINEGEIIPVSRVASDEIYITPVRATGIVAFSREMLEFLSAGGSNFLSMEMRRAIAAAADTAFFALITDGSTPTQASTGSDAIAALVDCRFLLNSVALTAESRPLWVMAPDVARKGSTLIDAGIGIVFPGLTPMGGELLGLPAMVTDALAAGTLGLIDGAGLAGDALGVTISSARHATLQLDSAPDSPATASTTMVSLFQSNLVGMKPEIYLGAERLRDNAFATVTAVNWGSTDSPA